MQIGAVKSVMDIALFEGIDAVDNGTMPRLPENAPALASVSSIISGFNPTWDSQESADDAFVKALAMAETIFDNALKSAVSKVNAKGIVDMAISMAYNHIMTLERFVPWTEYIFESTETKAQDIWYVVFPSNRGGWNFQCVPDAPGSFGQRHPVPASWRGLRGKDLQDVTGVADATFVHPAGFIGGAETKEGALELAKIASEG